MGVPAGPWYIGDALTFTVITHRFDTGVLTDADSVPTYRVYEDETGTAILTGSTAKLDDTNTTGFYSEQLTLSAANGFEVDKSYSIYVNVTVNSVATGQTFNFKVIDRPLSETTAGTGSFITTVTDSNAGGTNPLNGVTLVGTPSGSYTNLSAAEGTGLTITHDTNVIDVVFKFAPPKNSIPLSIDFSGYLQSSNDTCPIQAYDFDASSWITVASLNGQNTTTIFNLDVALGEQRFQSAGVTYIRFHSTVTNSQVLFLDKLVLAYANQTVGYANGSIWVDSSASNAGTTSFVDGVADNPVSTLEAASTLSTNLNLRSFVFASGSSFTLAAAFAGKTVNGEGFTIALGGQNVGGSVFRRFASISGTGTGTFPYFESGRIGTVTLPACAVVDCGFTGTFTASSSGNYSFTQCRSAIAGGSAPTFDFSGRGAAVNVFFRYWSGGMNLTVDSDCTVSVDVVSGGSITISGTGGSVFVRGMCKVVDSSSGAVTISQDSVINMTKINTEADTAISDAFNFTVSGQVDANIQYVNDIMVNGNGQTGTEWGP